MSRKFLLDSSVWVNITKEDAASKDKLLEVLDAGHQVHHCAPVVMEVIAGSRRGDDFKLQMQLDAFSELSHDVHFDFWRAGIMYRDLRRKGVTVKNLVDCLIAVIAMAHEGVTLIHDDQDFELIAQHYDLKQERWARAA